MVKMKRICESTKEEHAYNNWFSAMERVTLKHLQESSNQQHHMHKNSKGKIRCGSMVEEMDSVCELCG